MLDNIGSGLPWSWRRGGPRPPCRPGAGRPRRSGRPGRGTRPPAPCRRRPPRPRPCWRPSPSPPWCSSTGPDTCSCSIYEAESDPRSVATNTKPSSFSSINHILQLCTHLVFRTVSHVDESLIKPSLCNVATHSPEHKSIISDLKTRK